MLKAEKIPPKKRLQQILRVYNPGELYMAQLRVVLGSDERIAQELESMLPKAQKMAVEQIREFQPTLH